MSALERLRVCLDWVGSKLRVGGGCEAVMKLNDDVKKGRYE